MRDLNDKVITNTLTAVEWNDMPTELQNIIESMGLTLSGADLDQLGKALAAQIGCSDFYSETGVADAYVATVIGTKQGLDAVVGLTADVDGLVVRFRPGNANTGASTLAVNGIAAKAIVRESGVALSAGDLVTSKDAVLRYDFANDRFTLLDFALPLQAAPVVPRGYIDGVILSRDAGDPIRDINFAAGIARDSTDSTTLVHATEMTKQLDAAWVAGDDVGGLFAGAIAASTWYHCFLIEKDSDGTIDAGFDTDIGAANIPVGYTEFRRVGSILTNAVPNIIAFVQVGDEFLWVDPPLDVNLAATLGTTPINLSLSVPPGLKVNSILNVVGREATSNGQYLVYSPDQADEVPSVSAAPLFTGRANSGFFNYGYSANFKVRTNTSRQVRAVSSFNTWDDFLVATLGWVDPRGRNA